MYTCARTYIPLRQDAGPVISPRSVALVRGMYLQLISFWLKEKFVLHVVLLNEGLQYNSFGYP